MITYKCDYCKQEYQTFLLPDHSIRMSCQVANTIQHWRNLTNYGTHICEKCIANIYVKFNEFCDQMGLGDVNGIKVVNSDTSGTL